MEPQSPDTFCAIRYRDGQLDLLDQRLLPGEEAWLHLTRPREAARAIRDMVVRGAPAIGITAAYGAALSVRQHRAQGESERRRAVEEDLLHLERARPTAVNLAAALDRIRAVIRRRGLEAVEAEARAIHREDLQANLQLGRHGAALLPAGARVITHCNTGALATGGHGTALGIIRSAHARQGLQEVLVDETRPWLQGARLTAWELERAGIPHRVMVEGAAAWAMSRLEVHAVITGADRIARNGDTANKIGTFGLALLAHHHGVPLVVAAPTSTLDPSLATGAGIPIEERGAHELFQVGDTRIAPPATRAFNPVFDVTPASLIHAIVTEKGVIRPPFEPGIREQAGTTPS